jgi:hypothetical protein
MNDCNENLNQTDEEILRDEVSDEALEAAAVAARRLPTLMHNTYCFACPSLQSAAKFYSARMKREGLRPISQAAGAFAAQE